MANLVQMKEYLGYRRRAVLSWNTFMSNGVFSSQSAVLMITITVDDLLMTWSIADIKELGPAHSEVKLLSLPLCWILSNLTRLIPAAGLQLLIKWVIPVEVFVS